MDKRTLRTISALRDSLLDLMNDMPVSEISVSALAESSDINRGTFYVHYKSIDDMLAQLQAELARELADAIEAGPKGTAERHSVFATMLSICEYFEEKRRYLSLMLGPNGDCGHYKVILDTIGKSLLGIDAHDRGNKDQGLEDRDYMYSFAVGGITNTIATWVRSDSIATPQEMALMLSRILIGKTEAERVISTRILEMSSADK